jgi:PAS domain S-box-containing protein
MGETGRIGRFEANFAPVIPIIGNPKGKNGNRPELPDVLNYRSELPFFRLEKNASERRSEHMRSAEAQKLRLTFLTVAVVWTAIEILSFAHELSLDLLDPHLSATPLHMIAEGVIHGLLGILGIAGLYVAYRTMLRHLAERNSARAEIARMEERYRRLVTTPTVGIWEIDAYGRTTFANVRMAQMLGTTVEELRAGSMFDFMDEEEKLQAAVRLEKRRQYEEEQHEFRFRRPDGSHVWTLLSAKPILSAGGEFQGALAIIIDISDRRRIEEDLGRSRERLALGDLRARIAADLHDDLGSTLSSTSIFGMMLRRELAPEAAHAAALLKRIMENLRTAQEALHDIVWSVNPENDTLQNTILRMREYAVEVFEARGIRFHLHGPEALAPLSVPLAIRRDLYLVFKEAVTNAAVHSGCTEAWLEIVPEEGKNLRIILEDNGKGISPTDEGRGNGLSNMRTRTRAIGGGIEIRPRAGGGTRVAIDLPIT